MDKRDDDSILWPDPAHLTIAKLMQGWEPLEEYEEYDELEKLEGDALNLDVIQLSEGDHIPITPIASNLTLKPWPKNVRPLYDDKESMIYRCHSRWLNREEVDKAQFFETTGLRSHDLAFLVIEGKLKAYLISDLDYAISHCDLDPKGFELYVYDVYVGEVFWSHGWQIALEVVRNDSNKEVIG